MRRFIVVAILAVAFEQSIYAQGVKGRPVPPRSADTRLMELAAQIPGFGGFFYEQDKPVVQLVGNVGAAKARLLFGPDVRIIPANYEVTQLGVWRDRLRSALGLPGAVFLDLDEARNRVVIGIDRATASTHRPVFAQHVAEKQVPIDAVMITETSPVVELQTLQDSVQPQPGGVKVESWYGGFECTLGFNVFFEPGEGFVTCSHCTEIRGEVTDDQVGFGLEVRDPPFTTGGSCPQGRQCRLSDSALMVYWFGSEHGAGPSIARPENSGSCTNGSLTYGSITINSTNPEFIVLGTSSRSVGQTVEKIGMTSGRTAGTVLQTCADINLGGTNITYLCQNTAGAGSTGGDSGSPVFHQSGNGVLLDGLLWGSFENTCTIIFSPISAIEYELGPMTIEACPSC